jgi:hypothetical protein
LDVHRHLVLGTKVDINISSPRGDGLH